MEFLPLKESNDDGKTFVGSAALVEVCTLSVLLLIYRLSICQQHSK